MPTQQRDFQSRAEHQDWIEQVKGSKLRLPSEMKCGGKSEAPFLFSVDQFAPHLKLQTAAGDVLPSSPQASLINVIYPLPEDDALRIAVSDLCSWSSFRLDKFYEAVDALTADVAYRHTDGMNKGLALVTAGHYHSRKMLPTSLDADLTLRCYMTAVGSASLEVRTDAIQCDPKTGEERLLNVCHTTMVALDGETMRPAKDAVPALSADPTADAAGQHARTKLAALHSTLRKRAASFSMQLRAPMSRPPTSEEMMAIHSLHQHAIQVQEAQPP